MLKYIIIALVVWEIYKLFKSSSQSVSFNDALKRCEKEQRQIARDLEKSYREQAAAWERQAKEDTRRDAMLAKHEERLAKLEYQAEQAERDIEHWNEQLSALYSMLDYELAQREATIQGGKEYVKHQNKVIALTNKVHAAESKLAKAEFNKEQAEKELSA